jgi:hypothetical protein
MKRGAPVVCTRKVTYNILPTSEPVHVFVNIFRVPLDGIVISCWPSLFVNIFVPEE